MTSRHASDGGRRGIAPWILITAVATVVVIAVAVTYFLIVGSGDNTANRSCSSQVVLPVVAAPGAAPAISSAAAAFDATAPVARSACVTTSVTSQPSDQVEQALAGGWKQGTGTAPAVWVTDSEAALLTLESKDSALTAGRDNQPLATSPVVIAVRSDNAAAVEGAKLSWQNLASAVGPQGSVSLPSGQHLQLALPNPTTNRATSYALQSMLAAQTGATVDPATVAAASVELAALGAASSTPQPATTDQALRDLAAGTGGFSAVPVVASDLATFSAATPGLVPISPTGSAVGDAVFAAPLTASWVTPTLDDAAALFLAYLRGPGGKAALTDHGFDVSSSGSSTSANTPGASSGGSTTGTGSSVSSGSGPGQVLPDAGQEVAAALATAIGVSPNG